MTTGPQQARVVTEFNEMYSKTDQQTPTHALGHATRWTFQKPVNNMCDIILTIVNPDTDTYNELLEWPWTTIHDCMTAVLFQTLQAMERLWKELYSKYVKDVLVGRNTSMNKANKKHQLSLFQRAHSTSRKSNVKQHLQQRRVTAISSVSYPLLHKSITPHEIIVAHENQPAVSLLGKVRLTWAVLLHWTNTQHDTPSYFNVSVRWYHATISNAMVAVVFSDGLRACGTIYRTVCA